MMGTFSFIFFLLLVGAVVGAGVTAWYFYFANAKAWRNHKCQPDEHEDNSV